MSQLRLAAGMRALVVAVSLAGLSAWPVAASHCGDRGRPPCPGVKVFGLEVQQGLVGYSLVAEKDTVVRILVGIDPPLLTPDDLAPLRIDRGELEVESSAGAPFTVLASIPNPVFRNLAPEHSERGSVNFYLDGATLPADTYRFTARLYDGATLLRVIDFGADYAFERTADLQLLIAFPADPAMDPDRLTDDPVLKAYLDRSFATLSRLFPVRDGVGLIDTSWECSGDSSSGFRYFIYPDLISSPPVPAEQADALRRFNLSLLLRPPLRVCGGGAQKIMSIARFPDGTSEGGNADMGGPTSRVGIALDGADDTSGAGEAGMIMAQEIGHNFGLVDRSAPNWDGCCHSKNFFLADLSAFHIPRRHSIAPAKLSSPLDPADYMCRNPTLPGPPGRVHYGPTTVMQSFGKNDDCVLFEVPDWEWLRGHVKIRAKTTAPNPDSVFYLVGSVLPDGSFRRLDSRLWPAGSPFDDSVDSPYSLVFVGAQGQILDRTGVPVSSQQTHDAPAAAPLSAAFRFPSGTTEVRLERDAAVLERLRMSPNPPSVALIEPRNTVASPLDPGLPISWRGTDPDGDSLTYVLSFSSDGGRTFLPIGRVFDAATTSYVWDTSFCPLTRQGRIRIEASDGFRTAVAEAGFQVVAAPPDCNHNGRDDALDIADASSADIDASGVPDECEIGTAHRILRGTALGGLVTAVVHGFSSTCSVTVTSGAGQAAASVAASLAAALNTDPCVTGQGIVAAANGAIVEVSGFHIDEADLELSSTDPGIDHDIPIPGLAPAGLMLLILLLAGAGFLRLRGF